MNVSIFLRQFGTAVSPAVVVQWLREADGSRLGAERLRALMRILPETHEIDQLKAYSVNKSSSRQLAAAERFYVELLALPKYARDVLWRTRGKGRVG